MTKPNEEQADFRGEESPLGSILDSIGPPPFHDSFVARRSRLYQQRSDMMDRIVRIQRDIMAIECILSS